MKDKRYLLQGKIMKLRIDLEIYKNRVLLIFKKWFGIYFLVIFSFTALYSNLFFVGFWDAGNFSVTVSISESFFKIILIPAIFAILVEFLIYTTNLNKTIDRFINPN